MDQPWKQFERKTAKRAGTRRTPLSGRNSGHDTASDSLSDTFYAENKWTGTKNKYSTFALRLRELHKHIPGAPKKANAIITSYQNEKIVAFQTNKKEINFFPLDLSAPTSKGWKRLGIWDAFINDPCAKGDQEGKIPLFLIHIKGKHGEVAMCRACDYETVKETYSWHNTIE